MPSHTHPKSLTRRQAELEDFVDICFQLLRKNSVKEIAKYTGLSTSTVYRLRKGRISCRCQWRTIGQLSEAAGLQIVQAGEGYSVSVAKGR